MRFITDPQTLDDLNLLGKYKANSIYKLFDHVQTSGGEKLLESMFQRPLTNAAEINKRSSIFHYFGQEGLSFPFDGEHLKAMQNYLGSACGENMLMASLNIVRRKFLDYIGLNQEYNTIKTGLFSTITILNSLFHFLEEIQKKTPDNPYQDQIQDIRKICEDSRLKWLSITQPGTKLSLSKMTRYDYLLRQVLREEMQRVVQIIADIDVCISVSAVARSKGFSYAKAFAKEHNIIRILEFRHPSLDNAITNTLSIDEQYNLLFLTGANMAGKSTFMKSFGIAVYLAHMGFPVAAQEMEFSVRDGIYSLSMCQTTWILAIAIFMLRYFALKK